MGPNFNEYQKPSYPVGSDVNYILDEHDIGHLQEFHGKFETLNEGIKAIRELDKQVIENPTNSGELISKITNVIKGIVIENKIQPNQDANETILYITQQYHPYLDLESQVLIYENLYTGYLETLAEHFYIQAREPNFSKKDSNNLKNQINGQLTYNFGRTAPILSNKVLNKHLSLLKLLHSAMHTLNETGDLNHDTIISLQSQFNVLKEKNNPTDFMNSLNSLYNKYTTLLFNETAILDTAEASTLTDILEYFLESNYQAGVDLIENLYSKDINAIASKNPMLLVKYNREDLISEKTAKSLHSHPDYALHKINYQEWGPTELNNALEVVLNQKDLSKLTINDKRLISLYLISDSSLSISNNQVTALIEAVGINDFAVYGEEITSFIFLNFENAEVIQLFKNNFENLLIQIFQQYPENIGTSILNSLINTESYESIFNILNEETHPLHIVPLYIACLGILASPNHPKSEAAGNVYNSINESIVKNNPKDFFDTVSQYLKSPNYLPHKTLIYKEKYQFADFIDDNFLMNYMEDCLLRGDSADIENLLLDSYTSLILGPLTLELYLEAAIVTGHQSIAENIYDRIASAIQEDPSLDIDLELLKSYMIRLDLTTKIESSEKINNNMLIEYYEGILAKESNRYIEKILINLYTTKGDFASVERYKRYKWEKTFRDMQNSLIQGDNINPEILDTILDIHSLQEFNQITNYLNQNTLTNDQRVYLEQKLNTLNIDQNKANKCLQLILLIINNQDFNKACGPLFNGHQIDPSKVRDMLLISKGISPSNEEIAKVANGLSLLRQLSFKTKSFENIYSAAVKMNDLINKAKANQAINNYEKLSRSEIYNIQSFHALATKYLAPILNSAKNYTPRAHFEIEAISTLQTLSNTISQIDLNFLESNISRNYMPGDVSFHNDIHLESARNNKSLADGGWSDLPKVIKTGYKTKNPFAVRPYFIGKYVHSGIVYKNEAGESRISEINRNLEDNAINLQNFLITDFFRPNTDKLFNDKAISLMKQHGIDPKDFFSDNFQGYLSSLVKEDSRSWNLEISSAKAIGAKIKSSRVGNSLVQLHNVGSAIKEKTSNSYLGSLFSKINPAKLIPQNIKSKVDSIYQTFQEEIASEMYLENVIEDIKAGKQTKMICSQYTSIMLVQSLYHLNEKLNQLAGNNTSQEVAYINYPIEPTEDLSKMHPGNLQMRINDYFELVPPPPLLDSIINFES